MDEEQRRRAAEKREREREKKRKELQTKIRGVEAEIKRVKSLKSDFSSSSSDIGGKITEWGNAYDRYEKSEIACYVKIQEVFEGVIAEGLKELIPDTVSGMNRTIDSMSGVRSAVAAQMGRLDAYIGELQERRRDLEARLAAL